MPDSIDKILYDSILISKNMIIIMLRELFIRLLPQSNGQSGM